MRDDPTLWDNQHAHLILLVYRAAFRLLRSDVFTARAAWAEVKRSWASGYREDEVIDALAFLVRNGELRCASHATDDDVLWLYERGPQFPVPWAFEGTGE